MKGWRGFEGGIADSHIPAGGGGMKLWTTTGVIVTALLAAAPALAQTNEQAAYEGAGVIAWILVGLIGGYLASRVVNKTGEGMLRDIVLGIVGGIIGGFIFRALGGHGVTGFNLWSILVAFVGGIVVLLLYHAVAGRRSAS
jgi:uncharacterized membrane protein YeaQ/YmgE (transglycosylase-associated protein family)